MLDDSETLVGFAWGPASGERSRGCSVLEQSDAGGEVDVFGNRHVGYAEFNFA
jgi:hypothetical protein